MDVVGYTDRLSVEPGQKIKFMVSCSEPTYQMDIVRLIHGDENPKGPGFKSQLVKNTNRRMKGEAQPFRRGSYIVVKPSPPLRTLKSVTVQAWVCPTLPGKRHQVVFSRAGGDDLDSALTLQIDRDGMLEFLVGSPGKAQQKVGGKSRLQAFSWYFVAASYDGQKGAISLTQALVAHCKPPEDEFVVEKRAKPGLLADSAADFTIGAAFVGREATGHFNGKIDGLKVYSRVLSERELSSLAHDSPASRVKGLAANWDFSGATHSIKIRDATGKGANGESVNFPGRAVTGHNWTGHDYVFSRVPDEYNAVWFHDDDLGDAEWKVGFVYAVPKNLKSGVYAAWLRTKDAEDYVPFFVRPAKGKPTAKIAFLVPTLSYLAYGNEHTLSDKNVRIAMSLGDEDYPKQPQDVYVVQNNLTSIYDRHSDGSGVSYISRLRPILNMRPKYNMQSISLGKGSPHQFNADLHLVDWMTAKGYDFDVFTDEDLHNDGSKLLSPYNVIVTGSHPEYWTEPMLDYMQSYLDDGGRIMYLGGNGFYWVTCANAENPYMYEVRRWGGTGSWMAFPGEYYCSFTGELGGVWRNRGRHPQKMLGIGFSAQGFDVNKPYRRQRDSYAPQASFMFEGIGKNELIGDTPSLVMEKGAAGFELDRFDHDLGTPAHALLLATASGFSDVYQHVIEEVTLMDNKQGGTTNPLVKADIVYMKYPNDGAAFSVGSISWCGSLSYNDYNNPVSRLTGNVLSKFATAKSLP